ncbi:MAG: hypothetical protein WD055_04290 [Candidatus Dependentiae bacterium]
MKHIYFLFLLFIAHNALSINDAEQYDKLSSFSNHKSLADACDQWNPVPICKRLCDRSSRLVPNNFLTAQLIVRHLSADSARMQDACCRTQNVSIPDFVFGRDILIKNIFLASKLADEGKFTLPGSAPAFGADQSEQYIACTADTKLKIEGSFQETNGELSLFSTFVMYDCVKLATGFYVPVRHIERDLRLQCVDGQITCGRPDNITGEDNIIQFFSDYVDFNDYIFNGILAPKCIECNLHQKRTGLGDVSVATILDFAGYSDWWQIARFGLVGILPTGEIRNGNILWEIEFGTGAFRFKPFIDIHMWTGYQYFNPRFYLDVIISAPFHGQRRIPQKKDKKSELLIPPRFQPFIVLPFDDFDATKREFADAASTTRIHYGTQVDVLAGNLFFNIMQSAFSAGLFYEGTYKGSDRLAVVCPKAKFNTYLLEKISNQIAHMIRWNVQWTGDGQTVFEFGSRHVLGGRNTFNINEIFASAIIYY